MAVLAAFSLMVFPALAGGLGFTGNFYRQEFELAPGESSAGTEAYVVIINTNTEPVKVEVALDAPAGVTLEVPETTFTLPSNGNKRLDIVVKVDASAEPGEYTLGVSATAYSTGMGIKVAGGGLQQAKLKIVSNKSNTLPIIWGTLGGLVAFGLIAVLVARSRRRTRKAAAQ